jgi:hypothetical protein
MIIKTTTVLSLLAGSLLLASATVAAEMKYETSGCGYSEGTIIAQTDGVIVGTSQVNGHSESKEFGNTGYTCQNVFSVIGKDSEYTGQCKFTDGKGNDTIGRYVGANNNLTWTFQGGTGKWANITGGGPTEIINRFSGAKPGSSSDCWKGSGTYKLPG